MLRAGRAAGFSEQSMKNARRRMKNPTVSTVKASFGGGWVWALDSQGVTEGAEGTKAASPDTFDTFAAPSPPTSPLADGTESDSGLFSTVADDIGEPDAAELTRRYQEVVSR